MAVPDQSARGRRPARCSVAPGVLCYGGRMRSSVVLRRCAPVTVLLAAAAFGACSAGRPTGSPPALPKSNAYHRADTECRQVATRETENVSPQTQASKAAISIYWRCMAAKGFSPPGALVEPAPSPAP